MKLIEAIPDLANFVILLGNGKLGTYRDTGEFVVQQNFTEMFAEHTAEFLKTYTSDPDMDGYRLGIVFPTQEERPWHSATLALEPDIVRKLYPSGGTRGGELTSFQKRNIERSVYQGIELLMEHHDEALPGVQLYCPVLFFRQTTLDRYAGLLQREPTAADRRIPVMEVLNFLAPIPRGRRNTEGIGKLSKTIYEGVINKGARKSGYGFFGEKGKSVPGGASSGAAITQQAEQAFSNILGERRNQGYSSWMSANCSEETRQRVGRWLVEPYKYVKPERLRTFTRFRGLGIDGLTLLADQHPIFNAPAGSQLLARGSADKWNMYLLDGAVELEAEDGEKMIVEANTPQAAAPIASLKPRIFTVTAKLPTKFLWIMDNLADTLINIDRENREQELGIESLRNS
ncbi:MAG: hypothetical protein ACWGOV_00475 [Acidiferrobacterales bacterium]